MTYEIRNEELSYRGPCIAWVIQSVTRDVGACVRKGMSEKIRRKHAPGLGALAMKKNEKEREGRGKDRVHVGQSFF